jgi:flagellar hook-basal body complex protein FliE
MSIQGINGGMGVFNISPSFPSPGIKEAKVPSQSEGFTKVLGEIVDKVNDLHLKADKSIQDFVTGESKGLHEVMIAVEKSSISFQFLNQVRNKALEAYQEILRMQV